MVNNDQKMFLNRYQIIEEVGQGGMAFVYKVWDSQRLTYLAMKLLREDYAMDKVFMRRFKREAQNLARLKHPNIVRFYGLDKEELSFFMLLDFVSGVSLKKYIFIRDKEITFGEIRTIMRALCSALHYAHSKGVIHCDIKPTNIMISDAGQVLLMDFGIARLEDSATATLVGAGTPAYMAPEQIIGKDPTVQTDIYALGIVLYELLTCGERPFTGEKAVTGSTSEKVRWEQINLDPPSPKLFNKHVSLEMEAIVKKCLSKEPSNRFQTINELLEVLESALKDYPLVLLTNYLNTSSASNVESSIDQEKSFRVKPQNKGALYAIGTFLLVVVLIGIYTFSISSPTQIFGSNQQVSDRLVTNTPTLSLKDSTTVVSIIPTNTHAPTKTLKKTQTQTATLFQQKPTSIGSKWNACPGADYYSRLQVNTMAFVSFDPPYNNNVRAKPGLEENLVGKIAPGEKIQIVSGPRCSNDWVWWKIKSLETGLQGWTSEGDIEDYWLVPEGLRK